LDAFRILSCSEGVSKRFVLTSGLMMSPLLLSLAGACVEPQDDASSAGDAAANVDARATVDGEVHVNLDAAPDTLVDATRTDAGEFRDELAVFVSTVGDDAAAGTHDHPFKSFAKAMAVAHAANKRVYACSGDYDEAITLVDGVDVFGGVDCQTFLGATGFSRLVPSTSPVVTVKATAKGVHLERIEAIAPAGTVSAPSSLAMFAANAQHVELVDVRLSASAGHDGVTGASGVIGATGDSAGSGGSSIECPDDMTGGGGAGLPGSLASSGGYGGIALCSSPVTFRDGATATRNADSCGHGGTFDGVATCTVGQVGCSGASGASGAGGGSAGTLSSAGYLESNGGTDGGTGLLGGGGGGGAAGNSVLAFGVRRSGGGGGGGGGAGYGGSGAHGGGAGGASIGLAAVFSDVKLVRCSIVTAAGGAGGNGGTGGPGGPGGTLGKGGESLSTADGAGCDGGPGGTGGKGGDGGGGGGGPSIGIAFKGTAPAPDSATKVIAGAGGLGGSRDVPARAGLQGLSAATSVL
jgi:hypothetical protein